MIVSFDCVPNQVEVIQPFGISLEEAAASGWPSTFLKDGPSVPVLAAIIENDFHLYGIVCGHRLTKLV